MAQTSILVILRAKILKNRIQPLGIQLKRSNRPAGSGTKTFAGLN